MHDRYTICDALDEVHIVFDDSDSTAVLDFFENAGRFFGFGLSHASNRFIEQQEFWLFDEQHGDFKPLFFAVGQGFCAFLALLVETDEMQDVVDFTRIEIALAHHQRAKNAFIPVDGNAHIVVNTQIDKS